VDRRTALRLGAAAIAAAAIGGGGYVQWRRRMDALASEPITGDWPEVAPGAQWLLPNLHAARMVVPDRPHSVAETRDPARRSAVRRLREFRVDTGAQRLRGGDPGPADPARMRLVAIGDSVTFGWGVAGDEAWPARLAAELTRRGHAVEVINAGVPAQRLEAMAGWLEHMAPALGVQGVLFTRRPYPTGPDPYVAYADHVARARRALPNARFHVFLPPISRFDPHGLQVYREEEAQLRVRLGDTPVVDLTAALRAAQGDAGCALAIEGGRFRVMRGATVLLDVAATEQDLPTEIYALFEADPSVREALFFDSGHPDAQGFVPFAAAVADAVEGARWFG
jgi:lysophospholipase L1-like esterase